MGKLYEAIDEKERLQIKKDITVQCIDFCEVTTAKVRAVLQTRNFFRASKDWKEVYYKMTQDGPEAQRWTDFEEDCDAVNQARASISVFSAETLHRWKDAILECG